MKKTTLHNIYSDAYRNGHNAGFARGYNPVGHDTFELSQTKDLEYIFNYKLGYRKGIYDGYKCAPFYNKYSSYAYVFEKMDYTKGIRKGKHFQDIMLNLHYERVVDVFETYIDNALFTALKKSCIKQPANDDEIRSALRKSKSKSISIIPFLAKFMEAYFLRLFYIELTVLYDSDANENLIRDFSEFYQAYRQEIDPDDNLTEAFKGIQRSTTTRRLKENLTLLMEIAASSNCPQNDVKSRLDAISLSSYKRVFSIDAYIANSLPLISLKADAGHSPQAPSLNFSAYISFLADELTKRRSLFTHCEKYKEKQYNDLTHNKSRDFADVTDKYKKLAEEINTILCSINAFRPPSEYLCSEFLFNSHFLKNQFFCSLNSELFAYLSSKIGIAACLDKLSTPPEESAKMNINRYYSLLEYLRFFDINMRNLEDCVFSSDDLYDCSTLLNLVSYEEISQDLKIPVDFLLAFLHEVYANRGGLLSDALQEFNSRQNLLFDYHNAVQHYRFVTGNAVTAVSNLRYGYGGNLQFSESNKVNSFAVFLRKHLRFYFTELKSTDTDERLRLNGDKPTTNQSLLINHLIHLSAFDGPI